MSRHFNTGFSEDESDSADSDAVGNTNCSLSRCGSSSSIVTDAIQADSKKSLECSSTSSETGWTDSKHSSYLDLMETNFVQNMFARSYCMEDLCGMTAPHLYHEQKQGRSQTNLEKNDYNTAQSRLHSTGTLEHFFDSTDWRSRPALRFQAPAGLATSALFSNPWVKHFRLKHSVSAVPSNNVDQIKSRDAHNRGTASFLADNVDQEDRRSNVISASEERKEAAVVKLQKSLKPVAGRVKACVLQRVPNDIVYRSMSKNKRRVLWSTYKQVHKTRQKTGDYVQRQGISVNQDDVAASKLFRLDKMMLMK